MACASTSKKRHADLSEATNKFPELDGKSLVKSVFDELSECVASSQPKRESRLSRVSNSGEAIFDCNRGKSSTTKTDNNFPFYRFQLGSFLDSASEIDIQKRVPRIAYVLLRQSEMYGKLVTTQAHLGEITASDRILARVGRTRLLEKGRLTTFSALADLKAWRFALHKGTATTRQSEQLSSTQINQINQGERKRDAVADSVRSVARGKKVSMGKKLFLTKALMFDVIAQVKARNETVNLISVMHALSQMEFGQLLLQRVGEALIKNRVSTSLWRFGYRSRQQHQHQQCGSSIRYTALDGAKKPKRPSDSTCKHNAGRNLAAARKRSIKPAAHQSKSPDDVATQLNSPNLSVTPSPNSQQLRLTDLMHKIVNKLKARAKPVDVANAMRCFRFSPLYSQFENFYGEYGLKCLFSDALSRLSSNSNDNDNDNDHQGSSSSLHQLT